MRFKKALNFAIEISSERPVNFLKSYGRRWPKSEQVSKSIEPSDVGPSSTQDLKPPNGLFLVKSVLLAHPTQLVESFPMGPGSTSGDKNSLRYDLGPHHWDCHVSTP
jgi:hypothetical protein